MIQLLFGKLFRELKEKHGWGISEISKKTGIDRMTLYRLKNAKNPNSKPPNGFNATLKLVDRICTGLGVGLNKVVKYKK